eukprot:TRINITY_DN1365_c0_g2_i2.p1 TRINITY_DN1365_c0_g2~~TRINITY_DN1365_c0_g2_i2.p1  ORF type:complete len:242 (+),score=50.36 TRINITY_DN1365_c0_g2_i2:41-727(+)
MDALSPSVSTLRVRGRPSTALREPHHLLRPSSSTHIPPHSYLSAKPISNISAKSSSSFSTRTSHFTLPSPSQNPSLKPKTTPFHLTAASGYAAALLDAARCKNTVDAVEFDVRRFSRLLRSRDIRSIMSDEFIGDEAKGEIVKEVAEKGRFHKQLVVLLKMMVEKKKVGLVSKVLEEFERIYDELSGTRVVLVSSKEKMKEEELVGIAKKVQEMSGAMKVKVRHAFGG